LLSGELRRRGFSVVHTREPGGTTIAEAVRKVLLNPASRIGAVTELFLYEASRAQHLAEVVARRWPRGGWSSASAFTDSTVAYQGFGRGLSLKDIKDLKRVAAGAFAPPHDPSGRARGRGPETGPGLEQENRPGGAPRQGRPARARTPGPFTAACARAFWPWPAAKKSASASSLGSMASAPSTSASWPAVEGRLGRGLTP